MFSINSLTGFSIITRYVWRGYSLPTVPRFTENGNITSSIEVSMYLKSAFNTVERIAFSIAFVDMTTVRTFLTGISWVDSYYRFASSLSFIPEKLLKLVKTPVVKFSGKLNSLRSALNSYAGKVFNSEHIKRHSHNFLRDVVINPGHKPFFLSADLSEKLFSGTSAFALEFRSKVCILCSHVFDVLITEEVITGSNCNINYPSIDSKNPIIINRFRRLLADSHMQVKSIFLSVIAESRSPEFPVKILPVIFRYRESGFHSTFDRSKSNSLVREVDVANSFIIPDSRERFALRELLKFNSFKGFTGNIPYPLKDRAGKFRMPFTNIIVSNMVDGYLAVCLMFKTILGNLVKHMVTHYHSLSEDLHIFLRQVQFKFNSSIHIHILLLINVNSLWYWGGRRRGVVRLLLGINSGVSATPAPRRIQ